jgi:hypothetical protein
MSESERIAFERALSGDYEHALGGLRGHIVYGELTAGDTPVDWMQVKVALPYLRDAERALVAERTRADAAEAECARLRVDLEATERDAALELVAPDAVEAARLRDARDAERLAVLATLRVDLADARASHAALAGAVRAEREALDAATAASTAAIGADGSAAAMAAFATADRGYSAARDALDALLSDAPAPAVVDADVVRRYLAATDAYDSAGLRVLEDDEVDDITEGEARDAARAALDAALEAL